MIDGCSRVKILTHIMMPLARAGIIAIGVYVFLRTWNEFMFALILTKGREIAPITVGLANLFTTYTVSWNTVMAITVFSFAPLLVIFIFLQRYIVSGITGGMGK